MLSHVPQPKCLLTFRSSPFNHQSSKSRFNYEPCLFSPPQNSIRTNKRAFSAIMGLSIGWQPRTETLCMFVSGYLCVCDNHVWVQSSPEVINGKSVCVCVCVCVRERERESVCVSIVWSLVCVGAANEGLKGRRIKLPHSLSLIKTVTCFTDEFWAYFDWYPPKLLLLGFYHRRSCQSGCNMSHEGTFSTSITAKSCCNSV